MVDMKGRTYNDPTDFERGEDTYGNPLLFPCNTQYMTYVPMLHRYRLTENGLVQNGIKFTSYMGDDNLNNFLDKVSKKIYDIIYQFVKDQQVYRVQLYRIATAPTVIYPSQYYMRKEFEKVLIEQARFMLMNGGDVTQISRAFLDRDGKLHLHTIDRNDGSIDVSDISPESLRTLETLGLLRWFQIPQFVHLDSTKF